MERNEEQNGRVQLEWMDKTQPLEMVTEIVLPDYRCEISRLLWVRPTVLPPTRFVGGGRAELSGPVRYNILYMAPDGALYSADAEESYAFSVPVELPNGYDEMAGAELCVQMAPSAVVSRVLGPRKLSVRCRMQAHVHGYAEKNLMPHMHGQEDGQGRVQRLCRAIENGRVLVGDAEHFELGDALELGGAGEEVRVICADGTLYLPDVSASMHAVRCRGEAQITVLLCKEGAGEGSVPYTQMLRIPFEREIAFDGVTPDMAVCAQGALGEIRAQVEDGKVQLDADAVICAQAQCHESAIYCRDMFLPGCRAEAQTVKEPLWSAGFCGNRNFSVSGERSVQECGIPANASVLHCLADAEISERLQEGTRTVLVGQLRCNVLYCVDGEYMTGELSVPLRTVLEESAQEMSLDCTAVHCRVTPGRDGASWRADAEVLLSMRSWKKTQTAMLGEVSFTPVEQSARADLEICYPMAGESLWEVSKRYGVCPEQLALANGISASEPGDAASLSGVRYLVMP